MFKKLFSSKKKNKLEAQGFGIYCRIIELSRNPDLFVSFDIADNIDGRFDCISLHLSLYIRRLENVDGTKDILETVLSAFISDMDRNLREMGVGDLSVGKQVKKMASAYQGRFVSYSRALDNDDMDDLKESLVRNLYRDAEIDGDKVVSMATYTKNYVMALEKTSDEDLLVGKIPAVEVA